MRIAVVVVTFNSARVIAACLAQVSAVLPNAKVCVVDNNSVDDTVERVQAAGPAFAILRRTTNDGYAAACNAGFKHLEDCSPDIVMVLNPDLRLFSGSVESVEDAFRDDAVSHAVGCDAQTGEPYLRLETPDWFESLRYSVLLALPRSWAAAIHALTDCAPWRRAYASGAFVAVRHRCWMDTGGFDEDFFLYYEDRDFSRRLRRAGHLTCIPSLQAHHEQGTSSSGIADSFMLRAALSGWLIDVAKRRGVQRAREMCRRTAILQAFVASVFGSLGRLGWLAASDKSSQLAEAAEFLKSGLRLATPSDAPDRALRRALTWSCGE